MSKPVLDPWLLNPDGTEDPFAGTVSFSMGLKDEVDPDAPITPDLQPEVITNPATPPEPQPVVPPVEPEPDQPETFELEDGTKLVLEKEKGQWKGSIVGLAGNPQVYWGKNKNELIINTLKAQANATKKIREQNLKLKFGEGTTPKPAAAPVVPQVKQLTAEEVFEIKTQLGSDPDLALESWFQKKTGLNVNQLVQLAQQGAQAGLELQAESVSKEFVARNPDYYSDPELKNFASLVKWIAKFKMGKIANDQNAQQIFNEMIAAGYYTVDNLEEAFADLSADGFMVRAPKAPQPPPPVVVAPEPAPTTPAPRPDSRIVNVETRPRAALGLRPSDVTPAAPPDAPTAPSVEDFEAMSDSEVASAIAAVRRHKMQSRRSN